MHPIFTSRTNFLLYLAAWLPLGAMFDLVLTMSGHMPWAHSLAISTPLTLILAFTCLSSWYTCRFRPFGPTPIGKIVLSHGLAAILASTLVLLIAQGVAAALTGGLPSIEAEFRPTLPLVAVMAVLVYILSVAFHYAMLAIESSREAEVLAREAELRALKAQVNPHFLFNSLNSISALTALDPVKARDMCIRLSDFLRISLRLGERSTISFGEELELARTYLEVEQVRFGVRLRVSEQIEDGCGDCIVPPLLVQPLVENAIKHGIATLVEGGEISISGQRTTGAVRFVIENAFDPEAPVSRRNGIGLRNVRDRLQARYGDAARIEIGVEHNRYRVALLLPCDEDERKPR